MCQSPTCRLVIAAAAERRGHIGSSPTPGEAAAPQGPAQLPHEVDSDVSPPPSGLPFRERGETMAGQLSDGEAARGCRAPGYCRLLLIWRSGGAAPFLCARFEMGRSIVLMIFADVRNALSPTLRYALPNTPRSFSVLDEIPPFSMVPRYDCGSPMNVYNHS
jgi:hypothetical protein